MMLLLLLLFRIGQYLIANLHYLTITITFLWYSFRQRNLAFHNIHRMRRLLSTAGAVSNDLMFHRH